MTKGFEVYKFVQAWFIATHAIIIPWLILFFPFFIIWQDMTLSMLAILYTGVLCFGIPFTLSAEQQSSRKRLKFIIVGAVFGQITPLISLAIDESTPFYNFFGITELDSIALGIAIFTGSIHGLFCAYIYHRIYYQS